MRRNLYILTTALAWLLSAPLAYAAGNIDATDKYAFSNLGGYINFAPTNGGVTVTSSLLTGYAWSANDGWINLSPTNGGVHNDGTGTLSGYAWDASAGWVNFSGVTIDSSGVFHGMATGGSVNGVSYAINFDCTHCRVVTSWRRASSQSNNTSVGGGIVAGIASFAPESIGGNKVVATSSTDVWQPVPKESTPPTPRTTAVKHKIVTPAPVDMGGEVAAPAPAVVPQTNPYTLGTQPQTGIPTSTVQNTSAPTPKLIPSQQVEQTEIPAEKPNFLQAVGSVIVQIVQAILHIFGK